LRSGFKNHPFFVCVMLFSVAIQICLTELNAFGLENLNPSQWFVCFVFAFLCTLIAPITGQQRNEHKNDLNKRQLPDEVLRPGISNISGAIAQGGSSTVVFNDISGPSTIPRASVSPSKRRPSTRRHDEEHHYDHSSKR